MGLLFELSPDRQLTGLRAQAIVRATIDLARNLELSVVAEGIESEEIAEHLAALGCEVGQGYHFSRPLAAVDLIAALHAPALA